MAKSEEDQKISTNLPDGPLYYGDSHLNIDTVFSMYMHYPRHLFEPHVSGVVIGQSADCKTLSVFQLPPGMGIGGRGLFNPEREFRDTHERATRLSLFGGLVQARDVNLETKLDLPDLPDDPQACPPEIAIPKALSLTELSEDEGFITTEVSSSSVTTPADSGLEEDLWEAALTVTPNQHYIWERIGCEPMCTEQPYLTEAGPEAVDKLCHMQRHSEYLVEPDTPRSALRQVSPAQLVKDIINLLIGIPSHAFPFSQEGRIFTIDHNMVTSGFSPAALCSFLADFITCGTQYHRLAVFSAPQELDSFYTGGLVLQAFTGAVRSVLQYYRAAILAIPKDVTVLGIRVHCGKAVRQIQFLAELCHCADKQISPTESNFPLGVPLISYLYQETLAAVNTDNYLLMLSLLRTTCQPFALFVQDWVFHGTFRDVYGEFMIQVNPNFLEARDEHYWEKGYTLASADETSGVPLFLADLAPAIFCCGKSLNLLRMCSPRHFLCGVSDSEIPRLIISYSRSDLHRMNVQCQMYVSRMRQVARQLSVSRAEQQRRAEAAQRELLETARRMAAAEIARLQGILDERKRRADAKKRVEFKRLKEQMTADLQRRADEAEEKKEENKAFMARLTRQEEALTEKEIELEKQARDELIAYYTELGEEAAKREQRALWRIRRARLETARAQLMAQDEAKWQAEMEEMRQAQNLLEKSSDAGSLPRWVHDHEGSSEPVQVDGASNWEGQPDRQERTRDWSLPKWAEPMDHPSTAADMPAVLSDAPGSTAVMLDKASDRSADEVKVEATSSKLPVPSEVVGLKSETANMPEWARRVLDQDGASVETVTVTGDDECDAGGGSEPSSEVSSGLGSGGHVKTRVTKPAKKLKTGIHMVEGAAVNEETLEKPSRLHVHVSQNMHATTETTSAEETKPHVKLVAGMSATKETESNESYVPHTKQSETMSATKETEEVAQKPHLKVVAGHHANEQSQDEVKAIPKLAASAKYNISTETKSSEWNIKKPSLFGHVSQLSKMDYTFQAPKLRRQKDVHANLESEFREFAVRPNIRMHKTRSATAETAEQVDKPLIHISKEFHASKESEYKDWDGIRRKRFQEQNVYGHSSNSTVQRLLYGGMFGTVSGTDTDQEIETKQLVPSFKMSALDLMHDDLEQLEDNFDRLNSRPIVDLLDCVPGVIQGGLGGYVTENEVDEVDAHAIAFTPLSVLLNQALAAPLAAQISLVNETVVNFFLVDVKMDEHFEALHRYLFMADGDFAENLTDILLEKLSSCHLPHEMLTPVFLNSALTRALQLSSSTVPRHADHLSFALHYTPEFFRHNAHDTLDCLDLQYKVSWPVNVVLTEACMASYGRVFTFMLQLKRVAWTLKDCWHKLKRDAIVKKAKDSCQFRQLQLHRQEMQHFVRVMQGYMANQIIQVTWKELQESLDRDVHSLDDLRRVHGEYLNKALFRCLLNKKAAPIMKIIQDISCLILKFCSQLASATWSQDPSTGAITHPNFSAMVTSYKAFKEYFAFLFKVVNKLAVRGYQPHLQELLLRLNFNDYYSAQ
nr:hypothetical protein BaRGS_006079 [Batillaria attramentaria]